MKEASCRDHILYDFTYSECVEKTDFFFTERKPVGSDRGLTEFTEVMECLLIVLVTKIIKLYACIL